jgi:hypothetical protein
MTEDQDVYLKTRKAMGPKKIWSEKLEADLVLASMFRVSRRYDMRKKKLITVKPHLKENYRFIPNPQPGAWYYFGERPDTKQMSIQLSAIVLGTVAVMAGAYLSQPERSRNLELYRLEAAAATVE